MKSIAAQATKALELYTPFVQTLEEALACMPHRPQTVFRGSGVPFKHTISAEVTFAMFTSTSLAGREALAFMNSSRPGTFYAIHATSGSNLNVTWYPAQQDLLLSTFTRIRVAQKFSHGMLQLLGRRFDHFIAHEVDVALVADEVAMDRAVESQRQHSFLFDAILATAVEPKVEGQNLVDAATAWCSSGTASSTGPFVLRAGAGGGKSMALLQLFSAFVAAARAVPLFVSLPQVPVDTLLRPSGLDHFVAVSLGLSLPQLQFLAKRERVVVLLDELDDIATELREQPREESPAEGIVALNGVVGTSVHVAVACRTAATLPLLLGNPSPRVAGGAVVFDGSAAKEVIQRTLAAAEVRHDAGDKAVVQRDADSTLAMALECASHPALRATDRPRQWRYAITAARTVEMRSQPPSLDALYDACMKQAGDDVATRLTKLARAMVDFGPFVAVPLAAAAVAQGDETATSSGVTDVLQSEWLRCADLDDPDARLSFHDEGLRAFPAAQRTA